MKRSSIATAPSDCTRATAIVSAVSAEEFTLPNACLKHGEELIASTALNLDGAWLMVRCERKERV